MTTTYYAYLRDRVGAAGVYSRPQLEQMIEAERNALWQMLISNPAYDERSRMGALVAFDEAAGQIFSEQDRRVSNGGSNGRPVAGPRVAAGGAEVRRPARPERSRSWIRDLLFLAIGAAVGFSFAYFGRDLIERAVQSVGLGGAPGVPRLVASTPSFTFVKSASTPLEGTIEVQNARGASRSTQCDVEVTYRQLLEYVTFDQDCQTVSFKFLPVANLFKDFNYLQGYMVFTTTIKDSGSAWKGTASVYFSIDASA